MALLANLHRSPDSEPFEPDEFNPLRAEVIQECPIEALKMFVGGQSK